MKTKILLLISVLILALGLFACGETTPPDDNETVRVMVAVQDGFTVKSQNPLEVKRGESAVFDIEIAKGYAFISTSAGSFDEQSGKLTVSNVTERTTVRINLERLDYDTDVEYSYSFIATPKDTTDIPTDTKINAGTIISVCANDTTRIFKGWSAGAAITNGGMLLSEEREFSFRASPDMVKNGAILLYANYSDANVYYYDLNGGSVNTSSDNMAENEYYTARVDALRVKVTLSESYCSFAESASTFWDDGTFYRDGYVLREYNTAPDGTGEAYSLGSKFFPIVDGDVGVLYCIWAQANPAADFTYESVNLSKPSTAKYAPDWSENGVKITSYLGSSDTVTVPEMIDGLPVISIAEGAFADKAVTTLTLPRTLLQIEDGAFVDCSSLQTLYFPNSIYYISDAIFDDATYSSFKNLIVNATMAPRYSHSADGAFAVKLSRVLAAVNEKMIIVISGSSTYQGLGTEYMEALLDGEYTVVNFGTTRPRPGLVYLEALSHYTDDDDLFIYAPENSSYMMGEGYLSWRLIRDLEGMNNLFRYVDMSNYYGYFSSIAELNQTYNYTAIERRYEDMIKNGYKVGDSWAGTDKNGDYQHPNREEYLAETRYIDAYFVTLNNRFKSMKEGTWSEVEDQHANKDYTDLSNITWTSVDTPEMIARMNFAIGKARDTGARVYFGFAPVDEHALVEEAKNAQWLSAFDEMIITLYDFDGLAGSCADYIFNSKYFYDCAFHVNDYGRTYRTYLLYLDVAEILGITDTNGIYSVGTDFAGCLFEENSDGTPNTDAEIFQ